MVLDNDLFAEVVGAVAVAGRDEPREQDRRQPRVRLTGALPVYFGSDLSAERPLRVRDLSAGGVGLLHDDRVPLDEAVVVHLPRADGRTLPVLGQVVYWEPLAAGSYAIGVRFEQVLTEATWATEAAAAAAAARTPEPPRPSILGRIARSISLPWRKAA